jgi:hypothetical protein
MKNRNDRAEGTYGRQHRGQQGEYSSRNTKHPTDYSLLRSAASAATIAIKTATVFRKNYASGHELNIRSVSAGSKCK